MTKIFIPALFALLASNALANHEYIIKFKQGFRAPGMNQVRSQLRGLPGVSVIREFSHYHSVQVEASEKTISALKAQVGENNLEIRPNRMYSIPRPFVHSNGFENLATATEQSVDWGIRRILATETRTRGEEVKVCISDTGIDLDHPDLANNIIANFNSIDPALSGDDDNGHGTHVAGTVAAINNGFGVVGVAPQAKLIAAKGLNASGEGTVADLAATIDGCISRGAQIINMSWGGETSDSLVEAAINRAAQAGIVLVAAAGNSSAPVGFPAAFAPVIAVSATDKTDKLAFFSNFGPQIAVAAPGVQIMSTFPDKSYRVLSGTSMASPHIVGVIALMLSQNPSATRSQILNGLQGMTLPDLTVNQQGPRGLVNALLSTTR